MCSLLGVVFTLVFSVTQWAARHKSIVVAKESELIRLAHSYNDKVGTEPLATTTLSLRKELN